MTRCTAEQIERHIRTHSERSVDDSAAVHYLENLLCPDGKIRTEFATNDTWPNIDGSFELVPDPSVSKRPKQRFIVQIKGTQKYTLTKNGSVKYQLKSLAFPAYIANEITLDPGILFVVLDAGTLSILSSKVIITSTSPTPLSFSKIDASFSSKYSL